jgi:hypothetical protein
MRYEITEHIGEDFTTHDYEGTPEEIAQLINRLKKPKVITFNPTINIQPSIQMPTLKEMLKGCSYPCYKSGGKVSKEAHCDG